MDSAFVRNHRDPGHLDCSALTQATERKAGLGSVTMFNFRSTLPDDQFIGQSAEFVAEQAIKVLYDHAEEKFITEAQLENLEIQVTSLSQNTSATNDEEAFLNAKKLFTKVKSTWKETVKQLESKFFKIDEVVGRKNEESRELMKEIAMEKDVKRIKIIHRQPEFQFAYIRTLPPVFSFHELYSKFEYNLPCYNICFFKEGSTEVVQVDDDSESFN